MIPLWFALGLGKESSSTYLVMLTVMFANLYGTRVLSSCQITEKFACFEEKHTCIKK